MLEAGAEHIQKSQEGAAPTPGPADSITAQESDYRAIWCLLKPISDPAKREPVNIHKCKGQEQNKSRKKAPTLNF